MDCKKEMYQIGYMYYSFFISDAPDIGDLNANQGGGEKKVMNIQDRKLPYSSLC